MSKNPFLSDPIKGLIIYTGYEFKRIKTGAKRSSFDDVYIIDKDQKTSIYQLKSLEQSLYKLSPTANKIYHYITHHLGKDKDKISLPSKKICEIADINAHGTFYNGVRALIKIGLIARSQGRANMYWINPHFIFNGSRIDFIKNQYGEEALKIVSTIKN